jgi:hypothetical protein
MGSLLRHMVTVLSARSFILCASSLILVSHHCTCHRDSFTALGCESLAHSAYDLILQQPACFDVMDALFTYIDDLNPCTSPLSIFNTSAAVFMCVVYGAGTATCTAKL